MWEPGAIIDTAGFNVTIPQLLQHSAVAGDSAKDGGLTKNGNGTLSLSGANTYTGNTTINAGTLELAQAVAVLATNSTVSIASGAFLQLDNSAVTNTVTNLLLNAVSQPVGFYSVANGNAAGYLTGSGTLQVVAPFSGPSGPATITNSIVGSNLSRTWPSGQGWRLVVRLTACPLGSIPAAPPGPRCPASPTAARVS